MPSKNIPVNGWPQIKELDIAAPILAELDKIETWQKSVKQETKSGAYVEFTNALALDASSVIAEITASQDLHGYDKPWVGGEGKNKMPLTVSALKSANTGGTWTGNSYAYNGATFDVNTDNDENVLSIKVSGTNTVSSYFTFNIPFGGIAAGDYYFNGGADGGSDSTYHVLMYNNTSQARVKQWDGTTNVPNITSSADVQIKVPNTTDNLSCQIRIGSGFSSTAGIIFKPMLRLSTVSDSTFEPYTNICPITGFSTVTITDEDAEGQTATVTVALGSTVYGGTLDLTSGELTITHANIASYNGETIGEPWISSMDEYTQGGTPTTGAQVVYTLATPTTTTLTPAQLEMVKGYNHISANSGNIEVTAYTGNTWN